MGQGSADRLIALQRAAQHLAGLTADAPADDTRSPAPAVEKVVDATLAVSDALPLDLSYEARPLLRFVVAYGRARDSGDAVGATVAAMSLCDVGRRTARAAVYRQLADPALALARVVGALEDVPVADVARLLGVTPPSLRRWRRSRVPPGRAARVVLVARVLTRLRSHTTAAGAVMWFDAPRQQLAGRAPIELLEDPVGQDAPALLALVGDGDVAGPMRAAPPSASDSPLGPAEALFPSPEEVRRAMLRPEH